MFMLTFVAYGICNDKSAANCLSAALMLYFMMFLRNWSYEIKSQIKCYKYQSGSNVVNMNVILRSIRRYRRSCQGQAEAQA